MSENQQMANEALDSIVDEKVETDLQKMLDKIEEAFKENYN